MKPQVEAKTSRAARGVGRREFLLGALATTGVAATYLSGEVMSGIAHAAPDVLEAVNSTGASLAVTPSITSAIASNVTPNSDFFIRNHFNTPTINEQKWTLDVAGMVAKPIKLSYSDILLTASEHRTITLECAGNLSGGAGVSTSAWTGLPLQALLKQAGVQAGATTVIFHGADTGGGDGVPEGTHFARAIPLEKAMDPMTLLAYEMNGAPLPPAHGFPLRALVSGWYGMDSVKWLTRIEVAQEPFKGYFQQELYVAMKSNGERQPITRMRVNCKFLRPLNDEEIRVKTYRIEGFAWAGESRVAKVELRFDGSGAWQPAVLGDSSAAMVWTPWSYAWTISRPGQHTIEVRATDDAGNSQPLARDPDRKDDYELNTPHRVSVKVGS
jgi:DMSO/TMAO reductase YedYZ molybdopterin-dependent catalytic subunit